MQAGVFRSASETPFEWRFAGGPIVALDCMPPTWPPSSGKRFAKNFEGISSYVRSYNHTERYSDNQCIYKKNN